MGFLGRGEVLIILLVVVLLFGATRIPQLAKSLGEGIKEFKKATKDGDDKPQPPVPPAPPATPGT
jgi:sec-independent protein translocase protein TatA